MRDLCDISGNNATLINYKEFTGNIIPNSWYKKITTATGKPDLSSIAILAEIVYWYRPSKDGSQKFRGDAWQTSYDHFEKKFGYNREALRRIFVKLEQLNLLSREFRTIQHRGQRYNNVLFLHLHSNELFFDKKISTEHSISATPSPQIMGDYIDKENKKEKNRSAHINAPSDSFNLSIVEKSSKTFTGFLPISEEDIEILKSRSGREFSGSFIKQLVLKLAIKYPEHKFTRKTTFLNYMVKALSNELLQTFQANNKEFKFASISMNEEEESLRDMNVFLEKIESSLDTSFDMRLKKKIIGRLEPKLSYHLLSKTRITVTNEKVKVAIISGLKFHEYEHNEIPDWIKEIILSEAKIIWGHDELHSISIEQNDLSSSSKTILNHQSYDIAPAPQNNIWGRVRQRLKKYYGDGVDKAWFSKLSISEENADCFIVKSPTGFIRDWVKTNYGLVIENELRAYYNSMSSLEFT